MSLPEQKSGPSPEMITTRASGSVAAPSIASASAPYIASVMAFFLSGRARTTLSTPSASWLRTYSLTAASSFGGQDAPAQRGLQRVNWTSAARAATCAAMSLAEDLRVAHPAFHVESVTCVHHWTDRLFSFSLTRPASFRFRSGEFVMIGLPPSEGMGDAKPVMRAYSIASPAWAEELEFLSIKVPDGPLTSRLQKIIPGDAVLMGKKTTGTLVLDALTGAERLFLISTGTGLAPFLSVARDPETYARFGQVVIVHTVREAAELAYRELFERDIFDDPLIGDEARAKLAYYPCVTREPFERQGRVTDRIISGALFQDLGMPATGFDPARDRAMLCGSMAMIKQTAGLLEGYGLKEGSNAEPGDFVIERAFVG